MDRAKETERKTRKQSTISECHVVPHGSLVFHLVMVQRLRVYASMDTGHCNTIQYNTIQKRRLYTFFTRYNTQYIMCLETQKTLYQDTEGERNGKSEKEKERKKNLNSQRRNVYVILVLGSFVVNSKCFKFQIVTWHTKGGKTAQL